MNLTRLFVWSIVIFQGGAALAQSASDQGYSSSASGTTLTDAYNPSAGFRKLSPSTRSSLNAMPSLPFGKSSIVSNAVALDTAMVLQLDDNFAVQTPFGQAQTLRNFVKRDQKPQTPISIASYYFHLYELNQQDKKRVTADVYLRVDVRSDGDEGEIFYFSSKPPVSIESLFKPVEAKISRTVMANIQLKILGAAGGPQTPQAEKN